MSHSPVFFPRVMLCQSHTLPKYSDRALGRVMVSVFAVPSLCAGVIQCIPLDMLCDVLCNFEHDEELKYDSITDPQQVRFTTVGLSFCVELSMTPLHSRA